jgi:hypothetical protein
VPDKSNEGGTEKSENETLAVHALLRKKTSVGIG